MLCDWLESRTADKKRKRSHLFIYNYYKFFMNGKCRMWQKLTMIITTFIIDWFCDCFVTMISPSSKHHWFFLCFPKNTQNLWWKLNHNKWISYVSFMFSEKITLHCFFFSVFLLFSFSFDDFFKIMIGSVLLCAK